MNQNSPIHSGKLQTEEKRKVKEAKEDVMNNVVLQS